MNGNSCFPHQAFITNTSPFTGRWSIKNYTGIQEIAWLGNQHRGVNFLQGDSDRETEAICSSSSSFGISPSIPSPWRLSRPSVFNAHQNLHKRNAQTSFNLGWQTEKWRGSERSLRCDSKGRHRTTCIWSCKSRNSQQAPQKVKTCTNCSTVWLPKPWSLEATTSAFKPNPLAMHTSRESHLLGNVWPS